MLRRKKQFTGFVAGLTTEMSPKKIAEKFEDLRKRIFPQQRAYNNDKSQKLMAPVIAKLLFHLRDDRESKIVTAVSASGQFVIKYSELRGTE